MIVNDSRDTAQVELAGKMWAHGNVRILDNNQSLVAYEATGPFNMELIEALERLEDEDLARYRQSHIAWVEIVSFSNSCMAPLDVIERHRSYLESLNTLGGNALACLFVIPDSVDGKNIMIPKFKEMYSNTSTLFRIYNNYEDALSTADLLVESVAK